VQPKLKRRHCETLALVNAQGGTVMPLGDDRKAADAARGEPFQTTAEQTASHSSAAGRRINGEQSDATGIWGLKVAGQVPMESAGARRDKNGIGAAPALVLDPCFVQSVALLPRKSRVRIETCFPVTESCQCAQRRQVGVTVRVDVLREYVLAGSRLGELTF